MKQLQRTALGLGLAAVMLGGCRSNAMGELTDGNVTWGDGVGVIDHSLEKDGTTVDVSTRSVTRNIPLSGNFTSIKSKGIIDVEYTTGPLKAELTGPSNMVEYARIKVEGKNLVVDFDSKKIRWNSNGKGYDFILRVSAPDVTDFTTSGTGDIDIKSDIATDRNVSMLIQGTGDIEWPTLKCSTMKGEITGTGDFKGKSLAAGDCAMTVKGTGDIKLETLDIQKGALSVTGTGDIKIETLNAYNLAFTCNGTGDITIHNGTAKNGQYTCNGVGDIKAGNLKVGSLSVICNGSGDVTCNATDSFSKICNSVGRVKNKGKAK